MVYNSCITDACGVHNMESAKLDVSIFNDEVKNVSIGKLDERMVEFILRHKPEFEGRLEADKDILFWKGRVNHTEKHRKDFSSDEEFDKCVAEIPTIIQNPDYISIHPKDESVCFIKMYSKHVNVAIKISTDGKMVYRTMYPLRESQLRNYLENNRAWRYEESA